MGIPFVKLPDGEYVTASSIERFQAVGRRENKYGIMEDPFLRVIFKSNPTEYFTFELDEQAESAAENLRNQLNSI